ncbi:hypothetical protein [Tychonema sp. LEGE 07203]|uniref:hypothetical protein n=1 Tax=Tychonema sp. LEGE 07203 TaxID=1828671 RepID=UPI00188085F7|nr:hypothetical protein [Tychonema sp. LEGE 07203]MBE9094935.1 hypothetical protein [Tychonema sp. LEGE 07203]
MRSTICDRLSLLAIEQTRTITQKSSEELLVTFALPGNAGAEEEPPSFLQLTEQQTAGNTVYLSYKL